MMRPGLSPYSVFFLALFEMMKGVFGFLVIPAFVTEHNSPAHLQRDTCPLFIVKLQHVTSAAMATGFVAN